MKVQTDRCHSQAVEWESARMPKGVLFAVNWAIMSMLPLPGFAQILENSGKSWNLK